MPRFVMLILAAALYICMSACHREPPPAVESDDEELDSVDTVDSAQPSTVTDQDGDGFPSEEDCDDEDALINPDAQEICNGQDDDCDYLTDDADELHWSVGEAAYGDVDKDGHRSSVAVRVCEFTPEFQPTLGDDCDDENGDVFPGQTKYFSKPTRSGGFDYNCDGKSERRHDNLVKCDRKATTDIECPDKVDGGYVGLVPDCGETGTYAEGCEFNAQHGECRYDDVEELTNECR